MDVKKQIAIKIFEGENLRYFDLVQALNCIDMTSTPLDGDARLDLQVVDFGPLLIAKRKNSQPTLEESQFNGQSLAFHLPVADSNQINEFLSLPGGDRSNPFQLAGAESQWLITADTHFYHVQVDTRWLTKVLGVQAVKDYAELTKVASRKSYDASVLYGVSVATQHALDVGLESHRASLPISPTHLDSLVTDIMLPCIMSDLEEVKASTRQKILRRALDYIRTHYVKPIRLTELAESVSTSVRNLQMIFKQELGVSPSHYIKQFRLHRFRHHLASSSSVSEAAYSSGFKHLGRLTEQYAKVFKNYPSEDLLISSGFNLDVGEQLISG